MLEQSPPNEFTGKIRITQIPAGDAPEWVRQAWVGIELPCHRTFRQSEEYGLLDHLAQPERLSFTVPQEEALQALALQDPNAAQWFVHAGFPKPGLHAFFSFGRDEAEILDNSVSLAVITEVTEEDMGQADR